MKQWTDWEIMRHQVAIGGRVVNDHDQPVAGAQVTITAMPEAYQYKVDSAANAAEGTWQQLEERCDRTRTQADGLYYFLDLPAGEYTVQGSDQSSGRHAETTVSVTWDSEGKVHMAIADLKLSSAWGGRSQPS